MQAREKAAGLKKGGAIKGPGTGTSDDVPIMASNGEFMHKTKATRAMEKASPGIMDAINEIADGGKKVNASAVRKFHADIESKKEDKGESRKAERAEGYKHGGAIRKMAATGVPHMADAGSVDEAQKRAQQLANQTAMYIEGAKAANPPAAAPTVPAPAPVAAGALPTQSGGAVFGLYPQLTDNQRTTYATGDKLRAGVLATGPSTFQPAIEKPATPQAPIVGGGSGMRMDTNADPRVPAMAALQAAPTAPAAATPATPMTPTAPVEGQVIRNGNSFSGTNVTGNQVSSLDTSQGYAQDLKDLARIDATKAAEQANAKSQEAYAQNAMLQDRALRGNRGAGAIRAANIATATTQRGQDQQAQAQGAIQKLAQQKFGLESQTAGLDNASKVQMQAAQAKLLAAKTPEEKLAAEENLRALQGKYEKAAAPQKFTVINLPDTEGQSGRIGGGQAVIDANGQIVTQGNASPALPPGMVKQIGTSGGKPVYLDKNGKQVIAKG